MMYLRLAWRNIWRNKRRTIITMSSIAFAVFFASVMQSMQLGSYDRMIDNVVRFHTGYIQIHDSGYWENKTLDNTFQLDMDLIRKVEEVSYITEAVPRLESFALASYGTQTRGVLIIGTNPESEDALTGLKAKVTQGDYFSINDKSVIVSEGLAKYLKLGVSDTIVLISQGYHGVNAAGKYNVKGIVKFPAPDLNSQLVYMPLPEAQWFYGAENLLTTLSMVVHDPDEVNPAMKEIMQHIDITEYEVMDWEEMLPELVQAIEVDYISGQVMISILYVIIGFGIFGTFLMMTNERKYEFGILLAIGMRRFRLQRIIIMEMLLIAVVGTLSGVILSLPITTYFHFNPIELGGEYAEVMEQFGVEAILPFSIEPFIFTRQAIVIFIITVILATYPLWIIRRLQIVNAMRE